jgi:hypothetical protein
VPIVSYAVTPSESAEGCGYCTFADTVDAPFSVKVQVFDFLLVEHAPEKFASRPPETLKVIDVPMVNDADPLDPLTTSRPAGLVVT